MHILTFSPAWSHAGPASHPCLQEALELRRKVLPAGHHDVAALTSALAEISSKLPAVPVTSTA